MIENLLMYTCAKHCHKRWSSDKAIAKIKRCSFFASQCRLVSVRVPFFGNLTYSQKIRDIRNLSPPPRRVCERLIRLAANAVTASASPSPVSQTGRVMQTDCSEAGGYPRPPSSRKYVNRLLCRGKRDRLETLTQRYRIVSIRVPTFFRENLTYSQKIRAQRRPMVSSRKKLYCLVRIVIR